jgi:hypothetical protein
MGRAKFSWDSFPQANLAVVKSVTCLFLQGYFHHLHMSSEWFYHQLETNSKDESRRCHYFRQKGIMARSKQN